MGYLFRKRNASFHWDHLSRFSVCRPRDSRGIKENRQAPCPYILRPGGRFCTSHPVRKGTVMCTVT